MSEATLNNRSEEFRKSLTVNPKMPGKNKPKHRPRTFIPKDPSFFDKNETETVTKIYTDQIRD